MLRNPLNAFNQANVLKELKGTSPEKFSLLLDTTNRVSKIINGNLETGRVSKALFEEDIETIAFNQFNQLQTQNEQCILDKDQIDNLLNFCQILSDYFENVLINTDNIELARIGAYLLDRLIIIF